MVSLFIFPFASALLVFSSSLHSAAAYQCQKEDNGICPGVCCQYQDPYQLLVGPTCHIQALWFSSEKGTWVWPFPTFRVSYYWDQESNGSIMGGEAAKPKKEETTEVLTMHPNWESHVNEETNSGDLLLPLQHTYQLHHIFPDILSVHHDLHSAGVFGVSSVLSSSLKEEQRSPINMCYLFVLCCSSCSSNILSLGHEHGGQVLRDNA
jgi:hypothetical protein